MAVKKDTTYICFIYSWLKIFRARNFHRLSKPRKYFSNENFQNYGISFVDEMFLPDSGLSIVTRTVWPTWEKVLMIFCSPLYCTKVTQLANPALQINLRVSQSAFLNFEREAPTSQGRQDASFIKITGPYIVIG